MRHSVVMICAMLAACSSATSTDEGGPISRAGVGFEPLDLTTGIAADAVVTVALVEFYRPTIDTMSLSNAVEVQRIAGAPLAVTATVRTESPDAYQWIDVHPVEPLAAGWYVLRFDTAALSSPNHEVSYESGVELEGGIVAARFRVGSQPFLRSARVCGTAGDDRPPVVLVDFSEPVHSPDGTPIVIRQDGAPVCSPIESEPGQLRADCAGLDSAAAITIELPPLVSASGDPLVRGPDGGPVPSAYTITPDERDSPDALCLRYPLVPPDALGALAGD